MGRDYTLNLRNSQLLEGTQLVDRNGNSIARSDTLFFREQSKATPGPGCEAHGQMANSLAGFSRSINY